MRILRSTLKHWLPLAVMATLFAGIIYGTVQQFFRTSADDPQIQMAQDAATALAGQQPVESVLPTGQVDLARSLAPYLIVFSPEGAPLAANATLHGQVPVPPKGVLEYTKQHGEDRLTWQPQQGVRSAIVVLPVSGGAAGYVLAGRSLREVEVRESQLAQMVGIGWAITLLATLGVVALLQVLPFTRDTG